MPEPNEREETKPTLAEALKGFEDSPTVEEYKAEFAGQPTPWKNALPSAPPLDNKDVPQWLEGLEYRGQDMAKYFATLLNPNFYATGTWLERQMLRTIASLRAALAAAEKERKFLAEQVDKSDQLPLEFMRERDAARREARELRDALRELYNVFPVVPIHDVDRHARIANAMDKARRLLGGEGANNG